MKRLLRLFLLVAAAAVLSGCYYSDYYSLSYSAGSYCPPPHYVSYSHVHHYKPHYNTRSHGHYSHGHGYGYAPHCRY